MSMIQQLLGEMEQEARTTRKFLERVPADKFDWKPHQKSMSLKQLSTHIAELPSWVSMALNTSELDFAQHPYEETPIKSNSELLAHFDRSFEEGRTRLSTATDEELNPDWTLRNGDQIYSVNKKGEVIRMAYCQIVHHRAQLGVYLRLLDIPIPGSYGPSADEPEF